MKVWIWIIVVLVEVLGGYWMFSGTGTQEVVPAADTNPTADASLTNPAADSAAAPAEGQ